jgi:hypothetical protein
MDPRIIGATARAAADKVVREQPLPVMVPGTVVKSQQQPQFGEMSALVHIDGDPAGELRQVDVIDGRDYPSGARVMVEFVPPQGAVIRGALDRSTLGPPCGWADCLSIVEVPDYQLLATDQWTLIPMDAHDASPGFAAFFEEIGYGWQAIKQCSVEVAYTVSWSVAAAAAGACQTMLLTSSGQGYNCAALDVGRSFACGDNHAWASGSVPVSVSVLGGWFHSAATMLTLEPGDEIAVGARWFSETSTGDPQFLAASSGCGRDLTARLAVHLLEPNEVFVSTGGNT